MTGTGPLGCAPAELALWSLNGECATNLQGAASLFNTQLVQMVKELNNEVGSHAFVSANAHDMNMDFISNPSAYGTYVPIVTVQFKRHVISPTDQAIHIACE